MSPVLCYVDVSVCCFSVHCSNSVFGLWWPMFGLSDFILYTIFSGKTENVTSFFYFFVVNSKNLFTRCHSNSHCSNSVLIQRWPRPGMSRSFLSFEGIELKAAIPPTVWQLSSDSPCMMRMGVRMSRAKLQAS